MAFHNTSERYQYIYGNNVRKLDHIEDDPIGTSMPEREKKVQKKTAAERFVKPAKSTNPETEAVIRKNRAKLMEFDWKYAMITSIAILFCAMSALFYLGGTVHLNNLSSKISDLKSEKAELESEQAALQAEIDKSVNLDEIRTFAKEELHMTYPDQAHVIYYTNSVNDYFRQYESVNASK